MNNKKLGIAIAAVVVVVVVVGGYILVRKQKKAVSIPPLQEQPSGLGGQIYNQAGNPAQNLPQANPFQAQKNPFQGALNPFEGVNTNPFKK